MFVIPQCAMQNNYKFFFAHLNEIAHSVSVKEAAFLLRYSCVGYSNTLLT